MKEFYFDKKAMYFTGNNNYGINVFWKDLIGQRGFRFWLRQLLKGIRCLFS